MTMKRWIIEEDARITQTSYYAVEARTLEEAIDLVECGKAPAPYKICDYGADRYDYDDSRTFRGTDAEWKELT